MSRVPEELLEVYGSAEIARSAIRFFQNGAGVLLRRHLEGAEARLADVRHGLGGDPNQNLVNNAIEVRARQLALKSVQSILSLMAMELERDESDDTDGSDE